MSANTVNTTVVPLYMWGNSSEGLNTRKNPRHALYPL